MVDWECTKDCREEAMLGWEYDEDWTVMRYDVSVVARLTGLGV